MNEMHNLLTKYQLEIKKIERVGNYSEKSFRTPLENLCNAYLHVYDLKYVNIVQEPTKENDSIPDFRILNNGGATIGYIECKNLHHDLNRELSPKDDGIPTQIERYNELCPNTILTNYDEFILLQNKKEISRIKLNINGKEKDLQEYVTKELESIFDKFFSSAPVSITNSKELSQLLAKRTKILKDYILEEMLMHKEKTETQKLKLCPFYGFYNKFRSKLFNSLSVSDFADFYAQIISMGLLFIRLSDDTKIDKDYFLKRIPKFIPILKDFFPSARFDDWQPHIVWILDEIIAVINAADYGIVSKGLSYKKRAFIKSHKDSKDPFLYFYEMFLNVYDKKKRIERGAFYTPESVVSFIIRGVDEILQDKFGKPRWYNDNTVKFLDFATGTGTFILSLIDLIHNKLKDENVDGKTQERVLNFVLENLYGFELMAVPYILCHFRIHQFLTDIGYKYIGDEKERAEIYLTNTLDNPNEGNPIPEDVYDIESNAAYKIKNEENVLAIIGNPPYNMRSSQENNTDFIQNLMKTYKEAVKYEKNLQPLNNDFIKFIRFAQWKIEQQGKGVVGIITHNAYLDGSIQLGMREELLKAFDDIYVLNLNGQGSIYGKDDKVIDENVFDIQVGVCIAFFVRYEGKKSGLGKVNYFDIVGTREDKESFLFGNSIRNVRWESLQCDAPDFYFKPLYTQSGFKKGISINDIFNEKAPGIATANDNFLVSIDKSSLLYRINDFHLLDEQILLNKYMMHFQESKPLSLLKRKLHGVNLEEEIIDYGYKAFDNRFLLYNKLFVERDRFQCANHIVNKDNIVIVYRRSADNEEWTNVLVTSSVVDKSTFVRQTAFAPLYLYDEDGSRSYNFNGEIVNQLKPIITKTDILPYIYGVLWTPAYREKYKVDLQYDYPHVPFIENKVIQAEIVRLGNELINLHLLKEDFARYNVGFKSDSGDCTVSKILRIKDKVYINPKTWFTCVSDEMWAFKIGGYRVLESWLKARLASPSKKRPAYTLTNGDINHFIKVCEVIKKTLTIMNDLNTISTKWIDDAPSS